MTSRRQAIQRNFARHAASYDRHALLQQHMAKDLVELLGELLSGARIILEVGCGTGLFTALLRQANAAALIVALDLDPALLARARERLQGDSRILFLAADGEAFAGGPFDLIVANSVFQWFSRPEQTLDHYFECLREGGTLAFSTLGPATFWELEASFRQAARDPVLGAGPEIVAQNFSGEDTWREYLTKAGFREIVLKREERVELYPSVREFLYSLKATGATNPWPRPFSPRLFRQMAAIYQHTFGREGAIPVTYEILWALARK